MDPLIRGHCRIRVRYSETDAMAVAHHSRHVAWMEVGRVELMRAAGMSYAQLERDGVSLPLVGLELRYRAAVRFDDLVEIETSAESCSRVRVAFAYRLSRLEDQLLLATGRTEHVAVDRDLRPVRLPEPLRRMLTDDRTFAPVGEAC